MARECFVTGKKTISGNKVSHAKNHNRRKWKPNLRTVRILVNGVPKKVKVSARALKSGLVERA